MYIYSVFTMIEVAGNRFLRRVRRPAVSVAWQGVQSVRNPSIATSPPVCASAT